MKENNVKCHFCGKEFHKKPSRITEKNYCSNKCRILDISNNNPNLQYNFDRSFFKNIDNEFKAWLLGWIASDGTINKNVITVEINKKDLEVLETIKNNFCKELKIHKDINGDNVSLTISSKEIMEDVLRVLNLETYGKKFNKLSKVNINDDLIFHFIRGVFEGDGTVRMKSSPEAIIASSSLIFLQFIQSKIDIKSKINKNKDCYYLSYYGSNALDFLDKIYNNCKFKMLRKYDKYIDVCVWTPILRGKGNSTRINNIYMAKTSEDAVFPSKTRASDSGYDLTLISVWKKYGDVVLYDTGIRVTPPFGYYFDLVPRSSISKTGYMLANGIGVIDRTYTGSIKVPLIKVDKSQPDIELPSKLVQIIPRPIIHCQAVLVDELEETERGEGGFGSTGK